MPQNSGARLASFPASEKCLRQMIRCKDETHLQYFSIWGAGDFWSQVAPQDDSTRGDEGRAATPVQKI